MTALWLAQMIEMLTWHQLGIHKKPCGFLNAAGFYDHLLSFFDVTVREVSVQPALKLPATAPSTAICTLTATCAQGFVREPSRGIAQADTDPAALIDKLEAFLPQASLLQLIKEGKIDKKLRG